MGARAYDPRTARWLQRDPIGIWGGHPNLYVYPRNDPINYFDVQGFSEKKKTLREECEELLEEITDKLEELANDIDNALQGKSPLEDLLGQIQGGKPGGHMCELEERMTGISNVFSKFTKFDCYRFDDLRRRSKHLSQRYNNLQVRLAKWLRQLEHVDKQLIRKLIHQLNNPTVKKMVIKLLRRMVKFVPGLGPLITIIFFIYDWYTEGFWNAVGGLVSSCPKPDTANPEGIVQPERRWQPDELPILRMDMQRLCLCGSLQPALG